MLRRLHTYILVVAIFYPTLHAQQSLDYGLGISPHGSYSGGDFDNVNLGNGNLNFHIPLFSLPQKGDLSLSFSLVFNNSSYASLQTCDPYSTNTCIFQNYRRLPVGPDLTLDQAMKITFSLPETDPNHANYQTPAYYAVDASGASHRLLFDINDLTHLVAVDGTGISFNSVGPYPYDSFGAGPFDPNFQYSTCAPNEETPMPGTITTGGGIKHVFHAQQCVAADTDPITNRPAFRGPITYMRDAGNNALTYFTYQGESGAADIPGAISDSLGRDIDSFFLTPKSTDVSQCPSLSTPNQLPLYSRAWTVPGPNDGTVTYIFCYTHVYYNTNFNNYVPRGYQPGLPPDCGFECYVTNPTDVPYNPEAMGQSDAMQSVVLPDHTWWGFVYDSTGPFVLQFLPGAPTLLDPAASPVGYADLVKVITPLGATYSYTYEHNPTPIELVSTRTIDSGKPVQMHTASGIQTVPAAIWTYTYFSPEIWSMVVTDPDGNDVVHRNVMLGQVEDKTVYYQGSRTANHVLHTWESLGTDVSDGSGIPTFRMNGHQTAYSESVQDGETVSHTLSYPSLATVVRPACEWPNSAPGRCPFMDFGIFLPSATVFYNGISTDTVHTSDDSIPFQHSIQYQWQVDTSGNYKSAGLFSLPAVDKISTTDGVTPFARTTYHYTGPIGKVTSISKWLDTDSSEISTSTEYDSLGRPEYLHDAMGRVTQVTYDNGGLFPSTIASPSTGGVSHVTGYEYDRNTGNLLSSTDSNSQKVIDKYDVIGRIWAQRTPDALGLPNNYTTVYCYPLPGTTKRFTAAQTPLPLPSSSSVCPTALPDTRIEGETRDGLGRTIMRQLMPDTSDVVTSTVTYTGVGQIAATSNPHKIGDPVYYASATYDASGRALVQCHPDNLQTDPTICVPSNSYVESIYEGGQITSFDESRHSWVQTSNALGKLKSVTEPGPLATNYQYDVLGDLTKVIQNGNGSEVPRVRRFKYNSLTQLTAGCNPESLPATVSCDNAHWSATYSYDPNGNVITKSDARGVVISYSYDELNRLLGKTYSGASAATSSSCFSYDTAPTGKGRLAASWTQSGGCTSSLPTTGAVTSRKILQYDAMGRVKQERQCTPANCATSTPVPYDLKYDYNLAGNPTHATDGIGQASWFSTYDNAGRLTGVSATTLWPSSLYPSQLFSAQGYSPFGGLTDWTMGIPQSGSPALTGQKRYDIRGRVSTLTVTGHE